MAGKGLQRPVWIGKWQFLIGWSGKSLLRWTLGKNPKQIGGWSKGPSGGIAGWCVSQVEETAKAVLKRQQGGQCVEQGSQGTCGRGDESGSSADCVGPAGPVGQAVASGSMLRHSPKPHLAPIFQDSPHRPVGIRYVKGNVYRAWYFWYTKSLNPPHILWYYSFPHFMIEKLIQRC